MGFLQRNIVYNVALSLSQVLFPLLVFPYVSRVIGPSGIGSVTFVDGLTQWFILVAALGIPIYGVREIAKAKDDLQRRSKVFSELFVLHIVAAAVLAVVFVSSFLLIDALRPFRPLFWIGTGILFASSCMIEWLFQGMNAFRYITVRTVIVRALVVALVFLCVRDPDDTLVYYGITLGGMVANVLLNIWYARKFIHYRLKGGLDIRRHLRPMIVMFLISVVSGIYTLLDVTILGLFTSEVDVGYYGAAMRLVKLVITVLVAVSAAIVPVLSFSFGSGRTEESFALLRKSFNLIVFIGVPAAVGLYIAAPNVIALFAGPDFLPAVLALQILSPVVLLIGLNNIFGMQILNPTHNERFFLYAVLAGMVVSVTVNVVLIPAYQFLGTAMANLLAEAVVCLLLLAFVWRRVGFRPEWRSLGQAALAAMPMVVTVGLVRRLELPLVVETCALVAAGMLVYVTIQYYVWRNPLVDDMFRLFTARIWKR